MNRQQRRKFRKIAETERRNLEYLERRNDARVDGMLGLYAVAIGLAHHNIYGPNNDDKIEPLIRQWNDQIARIARDDISYDDLVRELEDKTGVTFVMVNKDE